MPQNPQTRFVLSQLREQGAAATIDSDGDIVVQDGDTTVILSVNANYIHAKMIFQTAARPNALSVISRRLHQRLITGRMVYADDGGVFYIDSARYFDAQPSIQDTQIAISSCLTAVEVAANIANELGYQL